MHCGYEVDQRFCLLLNLYTKILANSCRSFKISLQVVGWTDGHACCVLVRYLNGATSMSVSPCHSLVTSFLFSLLVILFLSLLVSYCGVSLACIKRKILLLLSTQIYACIHLIHVSLCMALSTLLLRIMVILGMKDLCPKRQKT